VTRQQHKADQYLDVLEQEIIHRAPLFAGRHVSQLHWGGGTPTYLNKAQISRLMTLLRGNFSLTPMPKSRSKSIRVKLSWMSWIIYARKASTA
jgi:coproporphyrinogen III oxidase-like Fe-S oxidoreductase